MRLLGIDLGTTNSAVAWLDGDGPLQPRLFEVLQLVAAGEAATRGTLPSFLYFPTAEEHDAALAALPWDARPAAVAGVFARDHGAASPVRQVASAKSWLANRSVDRRAPLLPLHAEGGARLSPVDASAQLLTHIRHAWNTAHPAPGEALQDQSIVLTVPASFDEEARELTVEAARAAGLDALTLLEEPLAALYAWMASHPAQVAEVLRPGRLLLVCDVGGGTTDFSLVRAVAQEDEVRFERVAIGEHLLLGGDNVDVALAALLERRLIEGAPGTARLGAPERQALRRQASAAKERLLGQDATERVTVTLLGGGRRLVGGAVSVDLTRQDVLEVLGDFLPEVAADARPQRQLRGGLRELGLPYESDPAITRHLAAFLARAARAAAADAAPAVGTTAAAPLRPDAVLFNGGFFAPAVARARVVDTLQSWFGVRPEVLANDAPDAAVAIGAAFYAGLRLHAERASHRRLLIRSGSARSYYVGVQSAAAERTAVCVMPRGTEEGTRLALAREFTVTANQPAAFTLISSLDRNDALDAVVTFTAEGEMHLHAPLVTALRYGQRSRRVPLTVRLSVLFTEVGTLELWCESVATEHRWRLQFNLRAADQAHDSGAPSPDRAEATDEQPEAAAVLIADEAVGAAESLLRNLFAARAGSASVEGVTGEMENVLGHGKQAWPLPVIRRLADVLLEVEAGRRISARHEARWLNLAGFCMRPGFGASLDPWRVTEARKVYAQGLAFARDTQCQVEWLILWQRVSAGFNTAQQQELANRMIGLLGLGKRKPGRLNPQLLRDAWRLLAGLERLERTQRARLGDELIVRVQREPQNAALAWAVGRLGARAPFYGPLGSVVSPEVAERWLDVLLALKSPGADIWAAIAQIAARTDDPARDISEPLRRRVLASLEAAAAGATLVRSVAEHLAVDAAGGGRMLGESLPEGLRLGGT